MRILLIKMCRFGLKKNDPSILLSPPLGILTLASCIREIRSDEVRTLDLRLYNNKQKQDTIIFNLLREFKPQVVGLSTLTHEHTTMHRITKLIRDIAPDTTIIAGGPHPSMYPRRTLLDKNLDYIVIGEGEESLLELLETLSNKNDPKKILGIGGKIEDETFLNPERPFIKSLDIYPVPAWDLYDPKAYQHLYQRQTQAIDGLPYAGIMTTRGCPYHCTFCHNLFGKKLRKRSVDHIMEEFEILQDKGIQSIEFYDDSFNVDRSHMVHILSGIRRFKRKMNLSFPNGLRSDLLTNDDINLLKEAGTFYLSVAIETASERLQKLTKKNLDINRARQAINESVRRRIFTNGFFILGFPTETAAEMQKTIDFACKSPLHSALFFSLVPHPATEIGKMLEIDELSAPIESWNYFLGVADIAAVAPDVINTMQRRAFRRFYFSPIRAVRVFRDLPNYKQLLRIPKGLLNFFRNSLSSEKYFHYD